MGIREYFYEALRDQYVQNSEKSFLFRFLRQDRLNASSEEKGKPKREDFDRMPLDDLMGLLANPKLSLSLGLEDREWLCGIGERLNDKQLQAALKRSTREQTQYQLIQEAFSKRPEVVSEVELRKLRGLVLNALEERDKRKREDFDRMPLNGLMGLLANQKQSLSLAPKDREWLCGLGERAGGAQLRAALMRTIKERTQYQLIQKALREHPEVVNEEELRKLRRLVLDASEERDKHKQKDFKQMPLDDLMRLLTNRNLSLSLAPKDREWLCGLGERAGDAQLRTALENTTWERTQYQLIQEVLSEHPEVVSEEELMKLRELVLDAMVMQDAKTFLYNVGFPVDNTPKGRREPMKDRMLTMLDEWGKQTHHYLCAEQTSGSDNLTDEERRAWSEMFRLLQQMNDTTDIILPVRVDPFTGAGLYLVGIECYSHNDEADEEIEKLKANGQKCVFVCLLPSEVPNPDEAHGFYLYMTPSMEDTITCVNIEDGERMFAGIKLSRIAYDFFHWINGFAPPGTPEMLKVYFSEREQEEEVQLAEEGRRESDLDRQRHPMPLGKCVGKE